MHLYSFHGRSCSRKQNGIDDVNHTVAGHDVGLDNRGRRSASGNDGDVFAHHHHGQGASRQQSHELLTILEVGSHVHARHDVVLQHLGQECGITEQFIDWDLEHGQGIAEGFVGGGKDGEVGVGVGEGAGQVGGFHGSHEVREVWGRAGELSDGGGAGCT